MGMCSTGVRFFEMSHENVSLTQGLTRVKLKFSGVILTHVAVKIQKK